MQSNTSTTDLSVSIFDVLLVYWSKTHKISGCILVGLVKPFGLAIDIRYVDTFRDCHQFQNIKLPSYFGNPGLNSTSVNDSSDHY